jgi:hypothetical protein
MIRVEALEHDLGQHRVGVANEGVAFAEPTPREQLAQLLAGDRIGCRRLERMELDHAIDPVEQLGRKELADRLGDVLEDPAPGAAAEPDRAAGRRAEVAGHDDHAVAEVRDLAGRVGQPPVVEQLEHQVEHRGIGLLDLVEQHHAEGLRTHAAGQHALRLIAIADQPRCCTGHVVLAHVEANEPRLVAEQILGQRLRHLGLAGSGRAGEQEHAVGPTRIAEPGLDPDDQIADHRDRLGLAHDLSRERLLDVGGDQRAILGEQQLGHAGPLRQEADQRRRGDPRPLGLVGLDLAHQDLA